MIRKLPPELQNKVINELNEVPERIEEDLRAIREWLKKQPHLNVRDGDQHLITFLRGCKYSLQEAKRKIEFFYTGMTFVPEFYSNRDPLNQEIQDILNAGFVYILPEVDSYGSRIIITNLSKCNPDTMSILEIIKIVGMVIEILISEDDNYVICGVQFCIDLKNCPLKYALQLTPSYLQKVVVVLEKSYPLRIRGLHVIHCPQAFTYLYNLAKLLFSPKISKRVYLHRDLNQFTSLLPLRLLPKEYGGNNGSLETLQGQWKQKIESYREYFLKDPIHKSNESLRIGSPKTTFDSLELGESFRKLEID